MKKIAIIILLTVLLAVNTLYSQNSNLPSAFIDDIVGTRAWGLGGAYTVLAEEPLALIWNPSALQNMKSNNMFLIEHSQIMQFYDYSFIGFGKTLSPDFSIGIGLLHSGDEVMSETTGYLSLATDLSSFNFITTKETLPYDLVALGITFKYHYAEYGKNKRADLFDLFNNNHRVSGSAYGFSFDMGLNFRLSSKDYIGTTVKNISSSINWDSENQANTALGSYTEKLPLKWTAGYARKSSRWKGALDISKGLYTDVEDGLSLGAEYYVNSDFTLRGGYSQELVTADNKKLTAGLGLKFKPLSLPVSEINFAWVVHNTWKNHNSIMFSLAFPAAR